MISRTTVINTAIGVFVAGTSGLYFIHRHIQIKVRNLPHYKETFEILKEHEEAKRSLGSPIEVGKIDISDRKRNYTGKLDSKLRIPVSGNLNGGYLNILAKRNDEKDDFVTQFVELELQESFEDANASDQPGVSCGTYLIYERVNPPALSEESPQQYNVVTRWLRWLAGYTNEAQ